MFPAGRCKFIVILIFVLINAYLLIDFHLAASLYFGLVWRLILVVRYYALVMGMQIAVPNGLFNCSSEITR